MVITLCRNNLDPRLFSYLERAERNKTISKDVVDALRIIFKNIKLPAGDLRKEPSDEDYDHIKKEMVKDKENNLWQTLIMFDFYICLYQKSEKETEEIKKEIARILSSFIKKR